MATKKQILKSDVFNYSPALERQYRIELKGLVDKMLKDVSEHIVNSYRKNKDGFTFATDGAFSNVDDELKDLEKKYREIFDRQGELIAKRMVLRQLKYSRSSFAKIMKKLLPNEEEIPTLAGSVIPRDLEQVIKASIMENVSYIKNIPEKYFEQVTGCVARSMQAGGSIKQLRQEILQFNIKTRERADMIANDQTRKAYMSINLRNMAKAGIQKVEWVHSGGGYTVREYHYRKWDGKSGLEDGHPNGLNGFIFNLNDRPVIQEQHTLKSGRVVPEVRGYPAQLPNCKCVLRAIVEIDPV